LSAVVIHTKDHISLSMGVFGGIKRQFWLHNWRDSLPDFRRFRNTKAGGAHASRLLTAVHLLLSAQTPHAF